MTTGATATALAWQHYRAGDLARAEALGRQALAADPHDPGALYLLALVAHGQGRLADSVPLYLQFLRLRPDSAEAHNNLGGAYAALGRLPEALACYRTAVGLQPAYADALNNLGYLLACQGDSAGAVASYRRALAAAPRHPEAWCNLGVAHFRQGRADEAAGCFRQALALRLQYPDALNNLGNVLLAQGRPAEAGDCYRRALELRPDDARTANNYAVACLQLRRWDEAVAALRRSLACDPSNVATHRNLARLYYYQLGDQPNALACYREVLARAPKDAEAGFLVGALSGESCPAKPPAEFVAALYDERAARFERDTVERLGYRSPELLRAALTPPRVPGTMTVLDLGCGTGLCGVRFRDWAARLVGVDLSPRMVEQARAKGVHDELLVGDVLEPLQANEGKFDLVLASDVVLYLGDVQPLFDAVRRALRPGGQFAFTVDLLEGADYQLLPFGHYAHARGYLQKAAAAAGLEELSASPAAFPRDGGQDATGLVVVLRRSCQLSVVSEDRELRASLTTDN